jgi:hypothetical protein
VTGLSLALRRLRSWRARRTTAPIAAGSREEDEDVSVARGAVR